MSYNGNSLIDTQMASREIELLKSGISYHAIAKMTNTRVGSLKERNRLVYKIDIYEAFRQRIKREGVPNRLSITDDFGYYFTGFFDGEGCIVVYHRRRKRPKSYPEFRLGIQITIRDDDKQVLKYITDNIGGKLFHQRLQRGSTNPSIKWSIENIKDLVEIVLPLFDKYPLHSKKSREYQIWRPLVIQRYIATLGGETQRGGPVGAKFEIDFIAAIAAIKNIRKYVNGN